MGQDVYLQMNGTRDKEIASLKVRESTWQDFGFRSASDRCCHRDSKVIYHFSRTPVYFKISTMDQIVIASVLTASLHPGEKCVSSRAITQS
jgi:hypothetical protein